MKPCLVDVAVQLLFFARPETTKMVFAQIKKARPSKLYLYQDGPRPGREDDKLKIEECRKIVEDIDWDCEVHKNYSAINMGCDPSGYIAKKWMMESEEYGIFLEDDTVPSISFFAFCKELLDKYKTDDRVHMICGYNVIDEYENSQADYFFTKTSSIWGWATWRRVTDTWDEQYQWLENGKLVKTFLDQYPSKKERKDLLKMCTWHKESGKAYFESINAASMMLHSRVAIVPTKNMISNVGIGVELSTHAADNIKKVYPKTRKLFNKKIFEYTFPLKHPAYMVTDLQYKHLVDVACGNTKRNRLLRMAWKVYARVRYR